MNIADAFVGKAAPAVARTVFVQILNRLKRGTLTVEFPDGTTRLFLGSPQPKATLQIKDERFYQRVLLHGEIGFGESYVDGQCDSPDLLALVELAIVNREAVDLNRSPLRLMSRLRNRRLHEARENTVQQSADNIHAHYDIGNAFFQLWLDETLTYSSAVFESPSQSLEDAQRAKYRKMCEKARLTGDDHVLEIGSGWGGFAIFAAQNFGCRVTTITISQEQFDLATARVREAGLADKVDVQLVDYRKVAGEYDKIVSIEMFEAVGAEYFGTFFHKCHNLLKPQGLLVMQVITVPDRNYAAQRNGVNWIQKYIFPGGVLPSVEEMDRVSSGAGLRLATVEQIGHHYAVTLRQWRERFWAAIDEVRQQGFDERFVRMWNYYLVACEAGFKTKTINDVQVVFRKEEG